MAAVMSFGLTLFLVIGLEFMEREKEKDSIIYTKIYSFGRMLNEDIYWIRSIFARKKRDDAG
jgi:hypothetical protein